MTLGSDTGTNAAQTILRGRALQGAGRPPWLVWAACAPVGLLSFPDELLPLFGPVTVRKDNLDFPLGDKTTADVRRRIGRMWA